MTALTWIKMTIAALAALWSGREAYLIHRASERPAARPGPPRRLHLILMAVGLVGACAWCLLHPSWVVSRVHKWDVYHYYMGSKYFPELDYTGLYDCAVVADIQAGLGASLPKRNIRNLRTNHVESALAVASDSDRCLRRFTSQRWLAFKADIAWFRRQMKPERWWLIQCDHGYNSTPAWTMVGQTLTSLAPASERQIAALVLIDLALLVGLAACIWWAFGARPLLLAGIFWATNFPAALSWTIPCFLRQDWLVLSLVALCLLRKGCHLGAGVVLTWAALLRLFPALLLAGPAINALRRIWRARRLTLSRPHRRLALGCLAALLVLGGLSTIHGGSRAWPSFFKNIIRHEGTAAANVVGLKLLASTSRGTGVDRLKDRRRRDAHAPWRAARERIFAQRRPIFLLLVSGFVLLFARAVWGRKDWLASLLSICLLPVVGNTASYYYSIFAGLGLLYHRSPGSVAALCAYSALSWLCALLVPSPDGTYIWTSAVTLALTLAITVRFAIQPSPEHHQHP